MNPIRRRPLTSADRRTGPNPPCDYFSSGNSTSASNSCSRYKLTDDCISPTYLYSEYDFYLFNTKKGNITVTIKVSPSLNSLGDDRPLALALQVDGGSAQTKQFVPKSNTGSLPSPWCGNDGWVANSIIDVQFTVSVGTGAHTLKVWMIEPTVVVQKIIIDTGGLKPSYLGPPESVFV